MCKNKKSRFQFFISIADKLNELGLSTFQTTNIIMTILIVVYNIFTLVSPILQLANDAIISIGNFIMAAMGMSYKGTNPHTFDNDISGSFIFILIEVLVCIVFCLISEWINKKK